MLSDQGRTGVFKGAMATAITNLCDIEIIADAVFTTLVFRFPTGEAQEVDAATANTYLALGGVKLKQVKTFRLASGTLLVHFHYGTPAPA